MLGNLFKRNKKTQEELLVKLSIQELAVRLDKLENITIALARILKVQSKQLQDERLETNKNIKYVLDMVKVKGEKSVKK